ncbi:tetratricopeptide repeat protein [Salibacter halophilus]|uniref:Tetratricopeptide repeat protein n=1 Tax=Salibacter halophilus TaxID=1803916 RepID=A0A6N6MAF8_9FLAO|nr:tetratricopeptide repeat protein [Salibacter halophilus]KAB1065690.1 tetratricopeptide repeat protein [Salibacter halophilus]
MKRSSTFERPIVVFGFMLALVFVLYGKSLSYPMVLDDSVVLKSKYVQEGLSATDEIFTSGYLQSFNNKSFSYRPFTVFTFAAEKSLCGGNLTASRFIHLLLYSVCGFLVWLLSKTWFPKKNWWFHILLVALFIAHPIHTEVVSNLKSRDELLVLTFLLASLYTLFQYFKKERFLQLILSLLCFFLALLSKENAVTFLFIAPVTLYVYGQTDRKKLLTSVISMVVVFGLFFMVRSSIVDSNAGGEVVHVLNNSLVAADTFLDRISSSAYLLLLYFYKLIFPINLSWDYSYSVIQVVPFFTAKGIFSVLTVISIILGSVYLCYRKNIYGWAVLSIIISLLLVLNLFMLIGANFAERFLFMPSLFFMMGLSVGLSHFLANGRWRQAATALTVMVLLFYSVRTFTRNGEWESNETLVKASLESHAESTRVQMAMGTAFREKAEAMQPSAQQFELYKKGVSYYDKAIEILPRNFEALYNKGVIFQKTGRLEDAKKLFEETLAIDSTNTGALNNLGFYYFNKRRYETALKYFKRANEIHPNKAQFLGNIGSAYHNLGQYEMAKQYYERSLAIDPDQQDVQANYSLLLGR